MKRIFVIAVTAFSLAACDQNKTTTYENTDSTGTVMTDNYSTTNMYVPAEGDVTYRDGKVMVWRNNNYVEATEDVTLDNGIVVKRNGEVIKEDKVVKLEEGESVDRSGNFFNKAGEGIEDAWDATKKGVSKAAGAVKKGAQKVGEAAEDAVD